MNKVRGPLFLPTRRADGFPLPCVSLPCWRSPRISSRRHSWPAGFISLLGTVACWCVTSRHSHSPPKNIPAPQKHPRRRPRRSRRIRRSHLNYI